MLRYLKNNQGFTLVELVVGMTLTVLLMGAVFGILQISIQSYQRGMSQTHNNEDARITLLVITDELRYAATIYMDDNETKEDEIEYLYSSKNTSYPGRIYRGTGSDRGTLYIDRNGEISVISRGLVDSLSFTRNNSTSEKYTQIAINIKLKENNYGKSLDMQIDTIVTPWALNLQ